MEPPLRVTLLGDGATDRSLVQILSWVLRRTAGSDDRDLISQFAEPSAWPSAERGLDRRIQRSLSDFPCDLLFVHRDAEREPPQARFSEIARAAAGVDGRIVPVVPVRMTEAWLLFDEAAIRRAAGNPNGRVSLELPRIEDLERLPDPKRTLRQCLLTASELNRRRRDRLARDLPQRILRVADLIDDFAPLDTLPAFRELRRRTAIAVAELR